MISKEDLIKRLVHEIRTPMTTLMGFTELLEDTELSGEQKLYLKNLSKAGDDINNLINDALDIYRIEIRELKLEWVAFDIFDLIEKVIHAVAIREMNKGISLRYNILEGVPKGIRGDACRIRQVLINLIGVMINYIQPKNISVIIKNISVSRNSDEMELMFSVGDGVIGTDLEKTVSVSKCGRKITDLDIEEWVPQCLSLEVSCKLVEMMGGEIWFAGEKDGSGCFFFKVILEKVDAI